MPCLGGADESFGRGNRESAPQGVGEPGSATRATQPRNRQAEGEVLREPTQPPDGTDAGIVHRKKVVRSIRLQGRAGAGSRKCRYGPFGACRDGTGPMRRASRCSGAFRLGGRRPERITGTTRPVRFCPPVAGQASIRAKICKGSTGPAAMSAPFASVRPVFRNRFPPGERHCRPYGIGDSGKGAGPRARPRGSLFAGLSPSSVQAGRERRPWENPWCGH